jgi:hypothetical protein
VRRTTRPTCRSRLCEAFAERTALPLFLFNTPYSNTALTVELAEIDIVCGIKNPRGREHLLALQDRLPSPTRPSATGWTCTPSTGSRR